MTASLVLLSPGEAQRLTQRIKLTASAVRDGMFKLRNLVEEAKRSNVWQVLGYQSWTAYLADTLADEPMRLGREERQELVGYLAGEGLSTRAIAPIVGVDQKTVSNDLRREESSSRAERQIQYESGEWSRDTVAAPVEVPQPPRAATDPEVVMYVNANTGEVTDEPEPRIITGLDGKSYPAKAPTERRTSILDDARNAAWQLRKAIERLERIKTDDRFTKNKAEIMAALQPHLDFANEVLADL